MKTYDEWQNESFQLRDQKAKLEAQIRMLHDNYALAACPYKIGDIVEIKSYSFRERKGQVTVINGVLGYQSQIIWRVFGRVLRKDGTPGDNYFEFDENQDDSKNLIKEAPK